MGEQFIAQGNPLGSFSRPILGMFTGGPGFVKAGQGFVTQQSDRAVPDSESLCCFPGIGPEPRLCTLWLHCSSWQWREKSGQEAELQGRALRVPGDLKEEQTGQCRVGSTSRTRGHCPLWETACLLGRGEGSVECQADLALDVRSVPS